MEEYSFSYHQDEKSAFEFLYQQPFRKKKKKKDNNSSVNEWMKQRQRKIRPPAVERYTRNEMPTS